MTTLAALLNNKENIIVLFASPPDIRQSRIAELGRVADELAAISRKHALAKALLDDATDANRLTKQWGRRAGPVLAKHANSSRRDLLAKADAADLVSAREIAAKIRAEHGDLAGIWAHAAEIRAHLAAHDEHKQRWAKLDRLAWRSDWRFVGAVQ